jgi:hypothetical protein
MSGSVLADGSTIFFVDNTSPVGLVQTGMMIRKSGAFTNASLSGTYFFQIFSVDNTGVTNGFNRGFFCDYGTMTFDGAGNFTASTQEKYDQNSITGPTASSGTYGVASDGTFTLTPGGGGGSMTGGVLAGGTTVIFVDTTQTALVQIGILTLRSGAFTNASLSGNYYFQIFSVDNTTGSSAGANKGFFCDYGTMTFDGAGNFTASTREKYDQKAITGPTADSGTYGVASDGTFTLIPAGGGGSMTGGVLAGNDTIIFVDSSKLGLVQIGAMLRQ